MAEYMYTQTNAPHSSPFPGETFYWEDFWRNACISSRTNSFWSGLVAATFFGRRCSFIISQSEKHFFSTLGAMERRLRRKFPRGYSWPVKRRRVLLTLTRVAFAENDDDDDEDAPTSTFTTQSHVGQHVYVCILLVTAHERSNILYFPKTCGKAAHSNSVKDNNSFLHAKAAKNWINFPDRRKEMKIERVRNIPVYSLTYFKRSVGRSVAFCCFQPSSCSQITQLAHTQSCLYPTPGCVGRYNTHI